MLDKEPPRAGPKRLSGPGPRYRATPCCHAQGFRLDASAKVTLVKQIQYDGQSIEAAWPLGAAINDLSA